MIGIDDIAVLTRVDEVEKQIDAILHLLEKIVRAMEVTNDRICKLENQTNKDKEED